MRRIQTLTSKARRPAWSILLLLALPLSTPLLAQPGVEIVPQLPWQYDPETGSQVGEWTLHLRLTDTTAPIVAYSLYLRSLYDPEDDVPYWVQQSGLPIVALDAAGTPTETAEFVAFNHTPVSGSDGISFFSTLGVVLSLSAPFAAIDATSAVTITRLLFTCGPNQPELVDDLDGSTYSTEVIASQIYSVVTYSDATEAFIPAGSQVDHSLTRANSFKRGDVNGSGNYNLTDVILILYRVFFGEPISCLDAADANDDGGIDVSDPIFLLETLFNGGPAPPSPSRCGADLSPDPLTCDADICL